VLPISTTPLIALASGYTPGNIVSIPGLGLGMAICQIRTMGPSRIDTVAQSNN
jgi:hypothetical protein